MFPIKIVAQNDIPVKAVEPPKPQPKPEMTVAEFTRALSVLPMNFKAMPHSKLLSATFNGSLFVIGPDGEMIFWCEGEWHEIDLEPA